MIYEKYLCPKYIQFSSQNSADSREDNNGRSGLVTKSFRFFYDFQRKFINTNNKH